MNCSSYTFASNRCLISSLIVVKLFCSSYFSTFAKKSDRQNFIKKIIFLTKSRFRTMLVFVVHLCQYKGQFSTYQSMKFDFRFAFPLSNFWTPKLFFKTYIDAEIILFSVFFQVHLFFLACSTQNFDFMKYSQFYSVFVILTLFRETFDNFFQNAAKLRRGTQGTIVVAVRVAKQKNWNCLRLPQENNFLHRLNLAIFWFFSPIAWNNK